MTSPFFSIIAPDYEEGVKEVRFYNFIFSVLSQYHWDWELLVIHDGPRKKVINLPEEFLKDQRVKYLESKIRFNDWGHSLRDIGAKNARGKYLIFCNADNILYEQCLSILFSFINRKYEKLEFINSQNGTKSSFLPSNKIVLFGIKMRGNVSHSNSISTLRQKGKEYEYTSILSGSSPLPTLIDAMQLCCEREVFLKNGGWYSKSEDSDGFIISDLCKKNGYVVIPEVLGEHW